MGKKLIGIGMTAPQFPVDPGVGMRLSVTSIYESKGLEYDAVILANARQYNYPDSLFYNKLLYVAITRAAQKLYVHYFGEPASVLVVPGFFPKKYLRQKSEKSKE